MVLRRCVVDTNVLISRLLLPRSVPARAFDRVLSQARPLISDATLYELADVLARPKFDAYVSIDDRKEFVLRTAALCERVVCLRRIEACRDPKDDKFLEVAVNGSADFIVTGDADLLSLHPFLGIAIVSPAAVLDDDTLPLRTPAG